MAKFTKEEYVSVIQAKKQEAHDKMWLYIEVTASELLEECEPGVKNLTPCCKAMLDTMLEGDFFVVEPKVKSKVAGKLAVRYYVDNLSPSRRKYADVMAEQNA